MEEEFTIRTTEEIERLSRDIGLFSRKYRKLDVSIPSLTIEENQALLRHLSIQYYSTGCDKARKAGGIAFIIFLILLQTRILPVNQLGLLLTMTVFFVLALSAMCLSRIWSNRRTRGAMKNLQNHYKPLATTSEFIPVNTSLTAA